MMTANTHAIEAPVGDAATDAVLGNQKLIAGLIVSALVGEAKGRSQIVRTCQVLGGLADVPGPWPDSQHALERLNLDESELNARWKAAKRRGMPLPEPTLVAFVPKRLWPAVLAAAGGGPAAFVDDVGELLSAWAAGLDTDGDEREGGKLAEGTIDGLIVSAQRFARRLCELQKFAEQLELGDTLADWVEHRLPKFQSAAELEAVAANRDRSAPPLRAVRRAFARQTRKIDRAHRLSGKRNKVGLFMTLRDRALTGCACLGFRKSTLRYMQLGDYLPRHIFADGQTGPALRLRRLKGLKVKRIAAIPDGLASWIEAYIAHMAAAGFEPDHDTPLWQPNNRNEWGSRRLPSGNLIDGATVRTLAPFANGHRYSPHTLRHFAEKFGFWAGVDWLEMHKERLITGNVQGLPSSPQTFADVLLDHALHDITDRYKDIRSEQGRELWRRETANGLWEYVQGDRGARKAPDTERIIEARTALADLETERDRYGALLDQLSKQKQSLQMAQSEMVRGALGAIDASDIKDVLRAFLEAEEVGGRISLVADLIAEKSQALSSLGGKIERARQVLDEARAARIPVPDEVPDEEILWDENLLEPELVYPADASAPEVVRRWFDPKEFRWAFGEELLSPATLRRYMRGELPYAPGDPRNMFDPSPGGGPPACIERLSERRQRILYDSLPLHRYHPDVVARLDWLMTQVWPAPIRTTMR